MIPLKLVMTTAGLGRFTAAQIDAGVDLTVTEVGFTDSVFVVAPTLTGLPGEFRRIDTIAGESSGDNIVHMIVQDDEPLTYTMRGFGLYLADGTLFAAYSQADPIAEKSSGSMLALALDIVFPETGVENITFGSTNFLNPPATTERKGVVELSTLAEARAGDPNTVPTAATVKALLTDALPIGTITLWFGEAAPSGWAICDGREVARSDGAGTILTPDLRGRVPVGLSVDQFAGTAFGATQRNVTTGTAGSHAHVASATAGARATGATVSTTTRSVDAGGSANNVVTAATLNDPTHNHDVSVDVADAGAHDHAVSIDVTQPSLALLFIMKV